MNPNIAMKGKYCSILCDPPEGAEHFPYLILIFPWQGWQGAEPFGRIGVEELSVQVVCDATTVLSLCHHVLNSDLKWIRDQQRSAEALWIWHSHCGSGPSATTGYPEQPLIFFSPGAQEIGCPATMVVDTCFSKKSKPQPVIWGNPHRIIGFSMFQVADTFDHLGAQNIARNPQVGLVRFDNQGYSHPDPETDIFQPKLNSLAWEVQRMCMTGKHGPAQTDDSRALQLPSPWFACFNKPPVLVL